MDADQKKTGADVKNGGVECTDGSKKPQKYGISQRSQVACKIVFTTGRGMSGSHVASATGVLGWNLTTSHQVTFRPRIVLAQGWSVSAVYTMVYPRSSRLHRCRNFCCNQIYTCSNIIWPQPQHTTVRRLGVPVLNLRRFGLLKKP